MTACATRTCADERCGKALPLGHPQEYCDVLCRRRTQDRERTRRKAGTGKVHGQPAFIRRLREEVPEGKCVYCEGPLGPKQRFVCASSECRAEYGRDHRAESKAKGEETPTENPRESALAAEAAVELRAGTARLAVQLDGFRARVREFCSSVGVGGAR